MQVSIFYIGAVVRDNRDIFFVDFGSMPQENSQENMQENASAQQLFEQGLASQQQKNWDQALIQYQKALDKGPGQLTDSQAAAVFHNMSTVAYQKSDFLHAYIWSKKAVALNPNNHLAQQSIDQFSKKFEPPQVAHQISGYENFKSFLRLAPVDAFCFLTVILLFFTLWIIVKNLIQRRKAELAQEPQKGFPWSSVCLTLLTIFVLTCSMIRIKDEETLRGLIVTEKTAVQTAPGENKPVIFEAQAGTEVEVLQAQSDYIQVRYPGAFSGWILRKNIEILSR